MVVATGARPRRRGGPAGHPRVVDVRDVLDGRAEPAGHVVVIDELGFHQATCVAELLADRGCAVEVVTAGMVVGQDLGITLDMETWNVRAHAKGIGQATDLVVIGAAGADGESGSGSSPDSGGVVLTLLHHPTGETAQRHVRLGRAAPSIRRRTRPCGSSCAPRRSRCTASATASRRGGRTPP